MMVYARSISHMNQNDGFSKKLDSIRLNKRPYGRPIKHLIWRNWWAKTALTQQTPETQQKVLRRTAIDPRPMSE